MVVAVVIGTVGLGGRAVAAGSGEEASLVGLGVGLEGIFAGVSGGLMNR